MEDSPVVSGALPADTQHAVTATKQQAPESDAETWSVFALAVRAVPVLTREVDDLVSAQASAALPASEAPAGKAQKQPTAAKGRAGRGRGRIG
eukprot:720102-Rhodomonas_salina.1